MTDRELDVLVAEKVIGWTRCGLTDNVKPKHLPSKDRIGSIYDDWDSKGPHERLVPPDCDIEDVRDRAVFFCGCESRGEIPYYSTAIEHAWLVVDAMQAKGWFLDLDNSPCSKLHPHLPGMPCLVPKWAALFWNETEDRDGQWPRASAASAPRAICLAAAAALGVDPWVLG